MTSDLDIYRTASVLIREHGAGAALEAAVRANAMLDCREICAFQGNHYETTQHERCNRW